jgi:hypothetical protein
LLDGKVQADRGGSQHRAADAASAVAFEILAAVGSGGAAAAITFNERAQTYSKAAYFDKGEVLARVGVPNVDQVTFSYEKGSDAYLRLLPTKNLARPLPLASLNAAAAHAPLLRSSGYGGLTTINKHGALIYDPAGHTAANCSSRTGMQNDGPSRPEAIRWLLGKALEQGKMMIDLLTMPETIGALTATASAIAFIVVRHRWGRD